MVMKFVLEIFP